ncbi:MAG: class I SAM-dependent methyltransferase [Bryobacter sp.]|jgi:polyketide synthase PksL|nr:class I SAM-dependent methyltransferase [Bryobacter sp. CoA8 C33]
MMPHRREATGNAMGWSSNTVNELSELFVEACAPGMKVIDIGAAYGVAAHRALERGASVVANDLDRGALEKLQQQRPAGGELEIRAGRFPRDVKTGEGEFDLAHASCVFHFLTGRQLERAAEWLRHGLRPGGRVFVLAATPWMKPFAEFIGEYEARGQRGEAWPGWVENTRAYSGHRMLGQLPKSVHLLDGEVLERVFRGAGFDSERVWLFRRRDLPASLGWDGRENVGYIGRRI